MTIQKSYQYNLKAQDSIVLTFDRVGVIATTENTEIDELFHGDI